MSDQEFKEETIDTKQLLFRYYQYWHYFLISIIAFVLIGFMYNRYTKPTYSVSSTLLIRDDNNTQLGAENLLEGMELFSGKTNINNEIVLLKSFSLTNQAVESLNLGVSYYQHGFLQSNEVFNNKPFNVNVDSSNSQITGIEFKVRIIDNKTFNLSTSFDNHFIYDIKNDRLNKNNEIDFEIDQVF